MRRQKYDEEYRRSSIVGSQAETHHLILFLLHHTRQTPLVASKDYQTDSAVTPFYWHEEPEIARSRCNFRLHKTITRSSDTCVFLLPSGNQALQSSLSFGDRMYQFNRGVIRNEGEDGHLVSTLMHSAYQGCSTDTVLLDQGSALSSS